MSVEVIIPWQGGCPERHKALAWVLDRWIACRDWAITVAELPEGPWCKADAVIPAVERSAATVVIVADADVWCDAPAIEAAVDLIDRGEVSWAIPHRTVHRLDVASTAQVLAGKPLGPWLELDQPTYIGVEAGGIVAVARDLALDVPLDRRFVGWGGEDHAWGYALRTIGGTPWRGEAALWHLWHPHPERLSRIVGSAANEALRRRYWSHQGHEPSMRRLIEEAKCLASS